jgi:hypothetical protein
VTATTPSATPHGESAANGHRGDHHSAGPTPETGEPLATVTATAAARALGVRRESVYRLMREGRLPFIEEVGRDGRPRRRVPVTAIEERIGAAGRGPQATSQVTTSGHVAETGSATPMTQAGHQGDHHTPEPWASVLERLVLAEASMSTLEARLADAKRQATVAVTRLDEAPNGPWWRRRRERRAREVEALGVVRALASLDVADSDEGSETPSS